MEKAVGTRDQTKDVENEEKKDGMCEKCRDAGRGNIEVYYYFTGRFTGMNVIAEAIQGIY